MSIPEMPLPGEELSGLDLSITLIPNLVSKDPDNLTLSPETFVLWLQNYGDQDETLVGRSL